MAKRTKTFSYKKGDIQHLDVLDQHSRDLEIGDHFEKCPDPDLSDYGNRNYEEMSDYEKCTKSFKVTIIVED